MNYMFLIESESLGDFENKNSKNFGVKTSICENKKDEDCFLSAIFENADKNELRDRTYLYSSFRKEKYLNYEIDMEEEKDKLKLVDLSSHQEYSFNKDLESCVNEEFTNSYKFDLNYKMRITKYDSS